MNEFVNNKCMQAVDATVFKSFCLLAFRLLVSCAKLVACLLACSWARRQTRVPTPVNTRHVKPDSEQLVYMYSLLGRYSLLAQTCETRANLGRTDTFTV